MRDQMLETEVAVIKAMLDRVREIGMPPLDRTRRTTQLAITRCSDAELCELARCGAWLRMLVEGTLADIDAELERRDVAR